MDYTDFAIKIWVLIVLLIYRLKDILRCMIHGFIFFHRVWACPLTYGHPLSSSFTSFNLIICSLLPFFSTLLLSCLSLSDHGEPDGSVVQRSEPTSGAGGHHPTPNPNKRDSWWTSDCSGSQDGSSDWAAEGEKTDPFSFQGTSSSQTGPGGWDCEFDDHQLTRPF